MCLNFCDADYTRKKQELHVRARNNNWTVRTRELRSHAWRGCTVCHVEYVHGDFKGKKVVGSASEDHNSAICAGFESNCRGHDFNRPQQFA